MRVHEPCGCVHDGLRWRRLCETHHAISDALHRRALAEHNAEAAARVLAELPAANS